MLWFFLLSCLRWLGRLLLPIHPPSPTQSLVVPQLPDSYPCPACGYLANTMLCVLGENAEPLVQRTCLRCGARSHYPPVVDIISSPGLIHPAIPAPLTTYVPGPSSTDTSASYGASTLEHSRFFTLKSRR